MPKIQTLIEIFKRIITIGIHYERNKINIYRRMTVRRTYKPKYHFEIISILYDLDFQ